MSVIIGYQTQDFLVLAGDKRCTDVNGNLKNDNLNKIMEINEHLAIAISGNLLFPLALRSKLNEVKDTSNLVIEDIIKIVIDFYNDMKINNNEFVELPACFIIGGKARNCMYGMCAFVGNKGNINPIETERAIFPPMDMKPQECQDILVKHIEFNPNDFYIHTIKEVANKSKLVSPTGNVWIFNLKTKKGKLQHF
ncbi:hypothetical protein [Lachnotalea glycerini]|uniref:Uncharacterized protein n=1 Tax=Lachnotalea glycerini TaxID=1763509 RepID=A0A371JBM5_9FIRM|nr:hypothetical protein [Lachnotalea glycerini]RDY30160.1 hypothetical protein CG710_016100 [Lachnotalea glycerini]